MCSSIDSVLICWFYSAFTLDLKKVNSWMWCENFSPLNKKFLSKKIVTDFRLFFRWRVFPSIDKWKGRVENLKYVKPNFLHNYRMMHLVISKIIITITIRRCWSKSKFWLMPDWRNIIEIITIQICPSITWSNHPMRAPNPKVITAMCPAPIQRPHN